MPSLSGAKFRQFNGQFGVVTLVNEPEGRSEVADLLSANGYVVFPAKSAEQACNSILGDRDIGVFVVDLSFNDANGLDVYAEVKQRLSAGRQLKLIVLAESASINDAVYALRHEAVDFLRKPAHPDSILKAVFRAGEALLHTRALQLAVARAKHLAEALFSVHELGQQIELRPVRDHREAPGVEPATEVWRASVELAAPQSAMMRERAREVIRQRRIQRDIFGQEFVVSPHWDMLLDLFLASHDDAAISVTSLCIVSGVPSTTALRRIKELENWGMVARTKDDTDARRIFVALTAVAKSKLQSYFHAIVGERDRIDCKLV